MTSKSSPCLWRSLSSPVDVLDDAVDVSADKDEQSRAPAALPMFADARAVVCFGQSGPGTTDADGSHALSG
jgi:hypothetical protein